MLLQKQQEIARGLEWRQQQLGEELERALDEVIEDDVLRLIFTACHPVLSMEGRTALTLRMVCGLTTAEIARAFLVPEKTLAQRIVRAKKTLSEAHVPFETPAGDELKRRMASVLTVVYLIFNEGYTATSGDEWMRAPLAEEALRLGRLLVQLLPDESEGHALMALMELHGSRNAARRGANGVAVLLPHQNRALWDNVQIQRGLTALEKAKSRGGGVKPYTLQAAIAACHMRARAAEETDWDQIVLSLRRAAPNLSFSSFGAEPRGRCRYGARPSLRACGAGSSSRTRRRRLCTHRLPSFFYRSWRPALEIGQIC